MLPDLERIQEWRSVIRYAPALPVPPAAVAGDNRRMPAPCWPKTHGSNG